MQFSSESISSMCLQTISVLYDAHHFIATITVNKNNMRLFSTFISQIWNFILGRNNRVLVNVADPWSSFSVHILSFCVAKCR